MKISHVMAMCALVSTVARAAAADDTAQAKQHAERALAAYGLNHYDVAAAEYEKAFSLKPDPALLYDAAQAHRLNHNCKRALELYENYLRLFGDKIKNRDEVQHKIGECQAELAAAPPSGTTARPDPTTIPPAAPSAHAEADHPSGIFDKRPVLNASNNHFVGPCPTVVQFISTVFSNNPAPIKVAYRFERSDRAHGPEQEATLPGPGVHTLPPFRWSVSGAPGRKLDAWVQLKMLRPTPYLSLQEHFVVECR
ncbi:MAG TPA: hypothetical protein VFF06_32990 [Polyangia bacterium]|nr:hypothetical protein [Polyangia bacterium]